MPHYNQKERERILSKVEEYKAEGLAASKAARKAGITGPTYSAWMNGGWSKKSKAKATFFKPKRRVFTQVALPEPTLNLKADNADAETLRTQAEARLDAIEAKVDALIAALKAPVSTGSGNLIAVIGKPKDIGSVIKDIFG